MIWDRAAMATREAERGTTLLTAAGLAELGDFKLGATRVSPARRSIAGPGGQADIEPRVMQVLVALAQARGKVVTRDSLFERCWGGVYVGDDSLNRTILAIRRLAADVGGGSFGVETIPRTGYRLTGEVQLDPAEWSDGAFASHLSRRALIGSGIGLTVAASAGGTWWFGRRNDSAAVEDLVERGHQVLRESVPGEEVRAVGLLRQAVELESDNAKAWGLLALAYRNQVENGAPATVTPALHESERAARRALALEPANANALTALATLQPEFGNWLPVETKLRDVLAKDAGCVAALNALTLVLQSVGRAEESFRFNERAAAIDPLDVTPQYRLAIKSWIFGRVDEADLTLGRAMQVWPDHPVFWNTRLMVLTFSGRPEEALRFLDQSLRSSPQLAPNAAIWRTTLTAILSNRPDVRRRSQAILMDSASRSSGAATHAIMSLSNLGYIDEAFEVANGYYRWRGKLAGAAKAAPRETVVNDHSWRRTMALFTPATRAMRLDPRFPDLTRSIGMTSYWQRTRSRPDSFLFV